MKEIVFVEGLIVDEVFHELVPNNKPGECNCCSLIKVCEGRKIPICIGHSSHAKDKHYCEVGVLEPVRK